MKKLLIVLTFAVALFITEKAQAQLNIHAAYAPELIETYTPTADTTLFFHGISFGLDRTFRLSDHLDLTAGAQYRMNLRDVSEHYGIVIPLMSHGLIRERQTSMLSWGIQGKTTEIFTWPSNTELHHEWYGDDGYLKRFNVYAMAGAEFEFKQFTVTLGGRYGFLNLNKRNTGTTTKAYGFFLSFGHTF